MPNIKDKVEQAAQPSAKRAVAWVAFTKPVRVVGNIHATELTAGVPVRDANGFVDVPPMYRDADSQELVIGKRRISLASGLVGPYEFADAAKGKTAQ